jgi:hypothetical protein
MHALLEASGPTLPGRAPPLGPYDVLIAGQAPARGRALAMQNMSEFSPYCAIARRRLKLGLKPGLKLGLKPQNSFSRCPIERGGPAW